MGVLAIWLVTLTGQAPVFESVSITRVPSVTELVNQMNAGPPNATSTTDADRLVLDLTPLIDLDGVQNGTMTLRLDVFQNGTLTLRSVSLISLIQIAYRVRSYQLAGAGDLGEDRFDVVAKAPDGISAEQVPEMLQRLLADRFRLAVHRETRETPGYILVIAINGLGGRSVLLPPGMVRPDWSPTLVLADGPSGSARYWSNVDGDKWLELSGMTMGTVAQTLTSLLDVPVVDWTRSNGTYDIFLKWPSQGLLNFRRGLLSRLGVIRPGSDAASVDDGPAAEAWLEHMHNVGLGLESQPARIHTVVIDTVQKTPTDN